MKKVRNSILFISLLFSFVGCNSPHTHVPGDWITDKEPTCTEEGHEYQECETCGQKIDESSIPALGHTPGQWIIDEEASCTHEGSKHQDCTVCGETIAEYILELTNGRFIICTSRFPFSQYILIGIKIIGINASRRSLL